MFEISRLSELFFFLIYLDNSYDFLFRNEELGIV